MSKNRLLLISITLFLILVAGLLYKTYSESRYVPVSSTTCNESLWKYVHVPSRLKILKNCITVTGVIISEKREPDGDNHLRLRLDSQYSHLLNAKNTSRQGGALVLEPICENKATQKDSKKACSKYKGDIEDVSLGSQVRVTGSYVLDRPHGWNEIHPVSSILILK